jgi:phytoene dehydrogenase-like protein
LPDFVARPGKRQPHHYGQINAPMTKDEWRKSFADASAGKLPEQMWCELYFQSAHDASVAPAGTHTMSVFAQYVPHEFAEGNWETMRDRAKDVALQSIARFCSNMPGAVLDVQAMGPPDIEKKTGLSGGHIFQGECLPAYMWEKRLTARTPMPGFYLCGAATHPGGSVIGINGRNAAMAVLKDFARL